MATTKRTFNNVKNSAYKKTRTLNNIRKNLNFIERIIGNPTYAGWMVAAEHRNARKLLPPREHLNHLLVFLNKSKLNINKRSNARKELSNLSKIVNNNRIQQYLKKLNETKINVKSALRYYKGGGYGPIRASATGTVPVNSAYTKRSFNAIMNRLKKARSKGLNVNYLYRGLSGGVRGSNYGGTYKDLSISSWSSSKESALEFGSNLLVLPKKVMGTNPYIKYLNYTKHGNDEQEYILPPGRFLLRPKIQNKNINIWIVDDFIPKNAPIIKRKTTNNINLNSSVLFTSPSRSRN